ncbi:MAG: LacI family transcriptional regulator [Chloroflexi bacterium]|nr:LacI family transcriptional regulator [Chloroflexota bacterium]
MRVSIKDVARAAGVSHSTVSRALTHSPLIPETTRRRVERAAKKLGYAPNAMARGLITRQSRAIGVIVTSIADPFVAEIVRGIEQLAGDNGYRVVLGTSHNDPEREVNAVKALREWRVDSVIVASSRVGALYQPLLKDIGAPIVLINNQNQQKGRVIHSVAVDDVRGGEVATQYLVSLGHRVIGHIRGPVGYAASKNRIAGYRRALNAAGIPYDRTLIQTGDGRAEGGAQILKLLDHDPIPTAIFCYNDITAIGALRELKRRGIRVPRDLSLVGFDNIPFALYVDPPLTTIAQPMFEMGKRALQMALTLMRDSRAQVADVVIQGELIARASTRVRG